TDRRPRDEPPTEGAHRRPSDPRRGRRCPGPDLGRDPRRPPGRHGRPAHLGRPRRTDRTLGLAAGDVPRPDRRRRRPGHRHAGAARPGDGRRAERSHVMRRFDIRRWLPNILAPIAALLPAAAICSVILMPSGKAPLAAFSAMFNYAFTPPAGPESMTDII